MTLWHWGSWDIPRLLCIPILARASAKRTSFYHCETYIISLLLCFASRILISLVAFLAEIAIKNVVFATHLDTVPHDIPDASGPPAPGQFQQCDHGVLVGCIEPQSIIIQPTQ